MNKIVLSVIAAATVTTIFFPSGCNRPENVTPYILVFQDCELEDYSEIYYKSSGSDQFGLTQNFIVTETHIKIVDAGATRNVVEALANREEVHFVVSDYTGDYCEQRIRLFN